MGIRPPGAQVEIIFGADSILEQPVSQRKNDRSFERAELRGSQTGLPRSARDQLARRVRVRPPALCERGAAFDVAADPTASFAAAPALDAVARRDAARSPDLAAGLAAGTRLVADRRPETLVAWVSCSRSSASKPLIRRAMPNAKSSSVVPASG